jgi:transcriptional regulator of arginine metabolism
LQKPRDALGQPRFVVPDRGGRSAPQDALRSVLAGFAHRAVAAQNIVVIHSGLGSAPAIGRALDEVDHPKVVGTLAGDDTCLAIAANASDARDIAAELDELMR